MDRITKLTPTRWRLRFADLWPSKKPRANASRFILEPIMKVVVTTPEQFMGDVIGDINRRRGKIMNQETQKNVVIVEC